MSSFLSILRTNALIGHVLFPQILKEMKQWAKPRHTTAELEENQDKNRDPNVLPGMLHV